MRLYGFGADGAQKINSERASMIEPFKQATFVEKDEPIKTSESTPTAGTSYAQESKK
jgi:hypothetical protein